MATTGGMEQSCGIIIAVVVVLVIGGIGGIGDLQDSINITLY